MKRESKMNIDDLKLKIETKEEPLESYTDFKKRYYIYRADDIRAFIQRDGSKLKKLYDTNDKIFDEIKEYLKEPQQKLLLKYSDSWYDILNTEIDELTKYMLADFEEER